MRHKWRKGDFPQTCENCRTIRTRETAKLLMAITNSPPYNHYKYETRLVYITPENKFTKANDCITIKTK